jgi:hypothetical protein
MEVLGRNANIIPVASGQPFKMRESSSLMVVLAGTTATSITVQNQSGFAGTPSALTCIKNIYWASANNGTVGWNKLTFVAGAITTLFPAGTPISGYTNSGVNAAATVTVFHVYTSELTDPNNYLLLTAGGSGLVSLTAITSDLVHQRGPANLPIMAA